MLKKVISTIYIAAFLIVVLCVPIGAIMLICKVCGATSIAWIGCCVPLIIAIATSPILIIAKQIIDSK